MIPLDVQTIERALAGFEPAAVYVFGSAAKGQMRADSDVDIAFVPARPCDPYAVFQAAQELAGLVGREVDLVDLSRASAVMRAQVVDSGIRMIVNNERRTAEFEMYALSDYARANEERREVLKKFVEPSNA
jgi:predicted nucleotidyltransferase